MSCKFKQRCLNLLQGLIDVFNNLLEETNEDGWQQLQTVGKHSLSLIYNCLNTKSYNQLHVNFIYRMVKHQEVKCCYKM